MLYDFETFNKAIKPNNIRKTRGVRSCIRLSQWKKCMALWLVGVILVNARLLKQSSKQLWIYGSNRNNAQSILIPLGSNACKGLPSLVRIKIATLVVKCIFKSNYEASFAK